MKNKSMFFSDKKKYTKGLSWFYLPFALFSDIAFFFEPLIIGYILYLVIFLKDFVTLASAFGVITFYLVMNILSEDTIAFRRKIKLVAFAPLMYFLFYILSYVEYVALITSLVKIHTLKDSLTENVYRWKPIKRLGFASTATAL